MTNWSVLISFDFQVAPAEDAFKDVARHLNQCLAKAYIASNGATKLFVVLRYAERCASPLGRLKRGAQDVIDINCPIQIDALEPGTSSIDESLRLSLRRTIVEASRLAESCNSRLETEKILHALDGIPNYGTSPQ